MRTCDFCHTAGHDAIDCPNMDPETVAGIRQHTREGLAATLPVCDTCGERSATVTTRAYGYTNCTACHIDALAYGHFHGLHTDGDGEYVAECPSCNGHTPAAYRTDGGSR